MVAAEGAIYDQTYLKRNYILADFAAKVIWKHLLRWKRKMKRRRRAGAGVEKEDAGSRD